MIEDDELREVFKTASEEHLQNIDDGFLYLEKNPRDLNKLEELLREAHSLKGDAGMLGVKDVATLAHQIENLLGAINQGRVSFSSEVSDRLFQALDALRKLVQEAVSGEPSGVKTFQIMASLIAAEAQTPPETEPLNGAALSEKKGLEVSELIEVAVESPPEEIPTPSLEKPENEGASSPISVINSSPTNDDKVTFDGNAHRIETIRVSTRQLDVLMTQTGELTVTKIRIAHRLNEVEGLTNLWEEWSRDAFVNRFVLNDLENQSTTTNKAIEQLQNYSHRASQHLEKLGLLVNQLRTSLYEDTARLELIANELEDDIRTLRLLPLSTIFNRFSRMVRDLARQQNKQVELVIEGGETRADKRILEEMKDPLLHLLRNAIDHGIESPEERQKYGKPETAQIRLRGYQTPTHVVIEVSDDGRGIDPEHIKTTALKRGLYPLEELEMMTPKQIQALIFSPGFTTRTFVTEISGRGVGMDVVRNNVEQLKGSIELESVPTKGSTFRMRLGTALATTHVLIVGVRGVSYGIPVEFVRTTRLVSPTELFTIEGRDTIVFEEQPLSVAQLADLLELEFVEKDLKNFSNFACIILKVGEELLGVFVEALIDEQDVVLKAQSQLIKRVRNISGATILGTGEVCMVLNPADLIKSARKRHSFVNSVSNPEGKNTGESGVEKPLILLVEDSIATRTQEKRILEAAGYEVITAVDGLDGFNKLKTRRFDAVISDVQMPNLDGLSLTAKIRENQEYNELPIILVTSLASDEDKRRGAEAGANAYITKSSFNQQVLLDTLKRLI
ncbi:response regulator [Capilliphycus salinus ALCB114379]|uniref:hybrid sensor histidine kinase/response regulator n=1 Tax=Capilliphycus salinus TaxID=2768948 RepID=UPI0039A67B09